jgi:predicted transcriptional regulator
MPETGPKRDKRGLNAEERGKIIQLVQEGKTTAEIAKAIGRSQKAVDHFIANDVLRMYSGQGALVPQVEGGIVVRPISGANDMIQRIITTPQVAFDAGQVAGLDLGVKYKQLKRVLGGRGEEGEVEALFMGCLGLAVGGFNSIRAYHKVLPEERPEALKKAREAEITRQVNESLDAQTERIAKVVVRVLKEIKEQEYGR